MICVAPRHCLEINFGQGQNGSRLQASWAQYKNSYDLPLSVGAKDRWSVRIQIDKQRSVRLVPANKLNSFSSHARERCSRRSRSDAREAKLSRRLCLKGSSQEDLQLGSGCKWQELASRPLCCTKQKLGRDSRMLWKQVEVTLMRPLRCIRGSERAAAARD